MNDRELRERLIKVIVEEVGAERAPVVFHTVEVVWNWLGCAKVAPSRTEGWRAMVVAAIAIGIIDAERQIQGKDSVPFDNEGVALRLIPGGQLG